MPLTLTGTAADPTTSPQATGVADGDAGNSAGLFSGPVQAILNFISWLRTHIVPDTGGTFTGAVNGVTPTAAAHLTRKDYVDALKAAPGWTNLTMESGWSASGVDVPRLFKDPMGKVLIMGRPMWSTGGGAYPVLNNIPSGSRPAAGAVIAMAVWDGTGVAIQAYVQNGDIKILPAAGLVNGHYYAFTACYMAEA